MPYAALLAAVAGYADAVGFLRFGAFAGMMTGNAVLSAIALTDGEGWHALVYVAIIAGFFWGVVASRILVRLGCLPVVPLTVTAAVLVLCDLAPGSWSAPALAFAMGSQNAAVTRIAGVPVNTVFITGNLQRCAEGIIAWLWPESDKPADKMAVAVYALVWLGYAVGAALGALAQAFVAWPLFVPAVLLPLVLLHRRSI